MRRRVKAKKVGVKMRSKVAKRLKKKIYGDEDYRVRGYEEVSVGCSTLVSDKKRRWYQNAKKVHGQLKRVPKLKKEKQNESNSSDNN